MNEIDFIVGLSDETEDPTTGSKAGEQQHARGRGLGTIHGEGQRHGWERLVGGVNLT